MEKRVGWYPWTQNMGGDISGWSARRINARCDERDLSPKIIAVRWIYEIV